MFTNVILSNTRKVTELDQLWSIVSLGNSLFQIICQTRNAGFKAIEANSAGAPLIANSPNMNAENQKWFLKSVGGGKYQILCKKSDGELVAIKAVPNESTLSSIPSESDSTKHRLFDPPIEPFLIVL
jgi:hypothetical protein